jgi:hypothetical protein
VPSYGPPQNNTSLPWSPLVTALIWLASLGSIATIVAFFVRFYSRHNEHPVYDDHVAPEKYARGLSNYVRLTGREKDEEEQEAKSR